MSADKLAGLFVMGCFLLWKAANDVCSQGHVRHLTLQVVTDFVEFLNRILTIHLFEDCV